MLKIIHENQADIFYATTQSAGFDITSSIDETIPPGEWKCLPTGLRIVESQKIVLQDEQKTPWHFLPEIQVRPRSGLALKHGITVLNTPSTIDADYRGEIKITLINHGKAKFIVKKGDRIAQGICNYVLQLPSFSVKEAIRGESGFGSTGIS